MSPNDQDTEVTKNRPHLKGKEFIKITHWTVKGGQKCPSKYMVDPS